MPGGLADTSERADNSIGGPDDTSIGVNNTVGEVDDMSGWGLCRAEYRF